MKVGAVMSSEYIKQTFLADEVLKAEAAAAVEAVLAVGDAVPVEDEVRDRQVLIRVGEVQRGQWHSAA